MTINEQEEFEKILTNNKISFTVKDGLYFMNYQGTDDIVQTKGYSFLYVLKVFIRSEIVNKILM